MARTLTSSARAVAAVQPLPLSITRRQLLQGGVAAAVSAMFGVPGCATTGAPPPSPGFKSVPLSARDTLVVPEGYKASTLFAWGDPVGSAAGMPAFRFDASNSADEQALQAGMHHDGMQYYPLPYGSQRLVARPAGDESRVPQRRAAVHGRRRELDFREGGQGNGRVRRVSVIEVELRDGAWQVVRPSRYARRITADDAVHRQRTRRRFRSHADGAGSRRDAWPSAPSPAAPTAGRRGAPTSPARRISRIGS